MSTKIARPKGAPAPADADENDRLRFIISSQAGSRLRKCYPKAKVRIRNAQNTFRACGKAAFNRALGRVASRAEWVRRMTTGEDAVARSTAYANFNWHLGAGLLKPVGGRQYMLLYGACMVGPQDAKRILKGADLPTDEELAQVRRDRAEANRRKEREKKARQRAKRKAKVSPPNVRDSDKTVSKTNEKSGGCADVPPPMKGSRPARRRSPRTAPVANATTKPTAAALRTAATGFCAQKCAPIQPLPKDEIEAVERELAPALAPAPQADTAPQTGTAGDTPILPGRPAAPPARTPPNAPTTSPPAAEEDDLVAMLERMRGRFALPDEPAAAAAAPPPARAPATRPRRTTRPAMPPRMDWRQVIDVVEASGVDALGLQVDFLNRKAVVNAGIGPAALERALALTKDRLREARLGGGKAKPRDGKKHQGGCPDDIGAWCFATARNLQHGWPGGSGPNPVK